MSTSDGLPAILTLADVAIGIGGRRIVEGVSLELHAGRRYGLVGPNGCGKTTIMRAALGLLRPSAGMVRLFGQTPPPDPRRVGVSFGPRLTHPRRRVRTELWLRVQALGGSGDDLQRAWGQTGLDDARIRCVDLSLGQAQRLAVVCAFLRRPQLVVLDEPTVGLDVHAVDWLREQLTDHVSAGGCVWMSSHDLAEVERSVDEVIAIDQNRVVYKGYLAPLLEGDDVAVVLRSSDPDLLRQTIDNAAYLYRQQGDGEITVFGRGPSEIGRLLASARVPLLAMTSSPRTLETSLRDLYQPTGAAR